MKSARCWCKPARARSQLYRWCQAQLAMIRTGMVEAGEVFLPYLQSGGVSMYTRFLESGIKALPAPEALEEGAS